MGLGLFGPIGIQELIMMLFWILPIIGVVWAIRTLAQIRRLQDVIVRRLDAIDKSLHHPAV